MDDPAPSDVADLRSLITMVKRLDYSDERAEALNHLRQALGLLELRAWRRRQQGLPDLEPAGNPAASHLYVGFPPWWQPNAFGEIEQLRTDPDGHIHEHAFGQQGGG